jgi:carbon storage regulator
MLVLTRRAGQSVYIGDEIKITLVDIKGNQVRIGVDAPPSVRIFREEIYQQILEENQSAAALSAEVPADLGAVADQWKEKKPRPLGKLKADSKKGSEE